MKRSCCCNIDPVEFFKTGFWVIKLRAVKTGLQIIKIGWERFVKVVCY